MPNNSYTRFQVIAINDDVDFCECCGKTGLKKVVWIEDKEANEIKSFGVICALKPAKGFGDIKAEMKKLERHFKTLQQRRHSTAMTIYRKELKLELKKVADWTFVPENQEKYDEIFNSLELLDNTIWRLNNAAKLNLGLA